MQKTSGRNTNRDGNKRGSGSGNRDGNRDGGRGAGSRIRTFRSGNWRGDKKDDRHDRRGVGRGEVKAKSVAKVEKDGRVDNAAVEEKEPSLKLIGRNAVLEALNAGTAIDRILLRKPDGDFSEGRLEGSLRVIAAKAKERGIVTSMTAKAKLDLLCEEDGVVAGNHQGVIALCPALPYSDVDDIMRYAAEKGEDPFVVVLDEISDPRNLGAIIRTAEAVGAHGVIIPKRRACGMTSTVVRTSAGAAAYMKVARVTNIVAAIKDLQKRGLWVCCADMGGDSLYAAPLTGALAIVIGNEGEGVGELVKKTCDFAASIPMFGRVGSLNASAAAAVILYEVTRRKTAGR